MVKPDQGKKLLIEVQSLMDQWKVKPDKSVPPVSRKLENKISEEQKKLKDEDQKKGEDNAGWKLW